MLHTKTDKQPINIAVVVISLNCIFLYALIYFLFGEKLPIEGGLGWDGLTYAAYAKDFIHEITTTNDVYHVNRIFPSLLIYCVTKILWLEPITNYLIFVSFYILNSILLFAVGFLWYKICKLKKFNIYIYLFGFISLFINYASLKLSFYAPVFLDPFALFFGILVLYLYLRKKYSQICIALFFCFFTWPLAIVLSLPLIIYTFSDKKILEDSLQQKKAALILMIIFSGIASALLYIIIRHNYLIPNWTSIIGSWNGAWWPVNSRVYPYLFFFLPLNMIIACVYIYFVGLNSNIFNIIKNSYRIHLSHIALFLLLIIICFGVSFKLSHLSQNYTGDTIFSASEFLAITLLGSIAKPALNLIMHITFLGPYIVLWLAHMRSILVVANKESFGLLLFVILTYFMALNCHSRQLTFNAPFIVYLVCKALNNLTMIRDKRKFLWCYLTAAIIGSKIYYIINIVPLQGSILSYPFQRFFMNFGLWTGWPGYFFNLGIAVIMCFFVFIAYYRNIRNLPFSNTNIRFKKLKAFVIRQNIF